MNSIFSFGIGLLLILVVGKLLVLSAGLIFKILINALVGGVLMWIFNLFAEGSSLYLDITPIRAFIVGIFGPLGLIVLLLFNKVR